MSAPGTLSREDATRKAAALLRLAAKAGTPAEAANAAAHAQAMMDRYELSRSAVEYAEHAATAEPDEPFMEFGSKPGGELDGKRGPMGPRSTAFGHPGAGGPIGFADPEVGLAVAVLSNRMRGVGEPDATMEISDLIRAELGVA